MPKSVIALVFAAILLYPKIYAALPVVPSSNAGTSSYGSIESACFFDYETV